MFSDVVDDLIGSLNPLARAKSERLQSGKSIYDYASGSVHDAGLLFPQNVLKSALDHGFVMSEVYRPDSKGQRSAREAVAAYYPGSIPGDEDRIILTPGTSQSYWYVFTLLANAGDEIIVPRPCYPLFEYIAKLCKIRLAYYDLEVRDGRWQLNTESLSRAITPRTRGIVLISPHNPTGHVLSREETAVVRHIASEKQIPLIVDEVFYEFVFDEVGDGLRDADGQLIQRQGLRGGERARESLGGERDCPLVFTLNGFSKMFALPGMKIGWIKIDGTPDLVVRSVAALETIADTFLATNEIAQFAVPEIFAHGMVFMEEHKNIIRERFETMRSQYSVVPQGGFYGVRWIGDRDEDVYALELLKKHGVLVHPGYFYSLPEASIVFSFVRGAQDFSLV